MEELIIYEYQAKSIENALRLAARVMNSNTKKTCMDRDLMQAWDMIKNVLNKDINKNSPR